MPATVSLRADTFARKIANLSPESMTRDVGGFRLLELPRFQIAPYERIELLEKVVYKYNHNQTGRSPWESN
jgi:hypothetical protein